MTYHQASMNARRSPAAVPFSGNSMGPPGILRTAAVGRGRRVVLACALLLSATAARPAAGASLTLQTLHPFQSNPKNPRAELTEVAGGNLYGTTAFGGTNGENGTLFRLSPDRVVTVLHSFGGADGAGPAAGLTRGADGLLYGSAMAGGTHGDAGTLFRLDPAGGFTLLHDFGGPDGRSPGAALLQGRDGGFYGSTVYGGTNGDHGTLFRWSPGNGLATLYSFDGVHGSHPQGRLVQAADGNFYGTTSQGGAGYIDAASPGHGTVFRITPGGVLTRLYSFAGLDGDGPAAGLAEGPDGALYGTTQFGGVHDDNGAVFRITTNGDYNLLYSFSGTDGNYPVADLVSSGEGAFYGSTSGDRAFGGTNTYGTLFRVTPAGTLTTLALFTGANGSCPLSRLTPAGDGNFYGTTFQGGSGDGGTVFRLVAPPVITGVTVTGVTARVSWTSFTNGEYRLEYKAEISAPDWTALGADGTAIGNMTFADDPSPDPQRRFYRVRLLP